LHACFLDGLAHICGLVNWPTADVKDDVSHLNAIFPGSLEGLQHKGRGILLLHDIHERTAEALPTLLVKLKSTGFHIVHVVPAGPQQPKTATLPDQWQLPVDEKRLDPLTPTE
jgi:peptidoglycan-N-acetylglucosamine deacetylase